MRNQEVVVHTVQSEIDPGWRLLFDSRDTLQQKLPFFHPEQLDEMRFRTFLVATINNAVTGIVALRNQSVRLDNAVGVGYISTHKEYRNMGVATAMVHALFAHAHLHGKAIANTAYEPEGLIYLQPVMERVWNRYPSVDLNERDYSGPI